MRGSLDAVMCTASSSIRTPGNPLSADVALDVTQPDTLADTVSGREPFGGNCWIVCKSALKRRSEEHTSELQSLMRISYAVFCLKKKTNQIPTSRPFADRISPVYTIPLPP